ncbi:uncharacterized protein BJX67DRAFT_344517 [Aspergillus lucknowensis]|uniref:Uncharacterized protein n=1 Tax=Aspergillus lucknowensis TaxID=176173 RepID=A0ABR4M1R7_9EURO
MLPEHKLVGERWWWSGCSLGRGFILLCSQETGNFANIWFPYFVLVVLLLLMSMQPKQILQATPFSLYLLYNCRSTIACCRKFDDVVNVLLTDGRLSVEISKKEVQEWVKDASSINQESVPTIHWQARSTDAVASKASDFLSAHSNNRSWPLGLATFTSEAVTTRASLLKFEQMGDQS